MKIRDIMTTGVTTAELCSTLEEIATIMRYEDVGAVPIVDGDELVGLVTDRDIVLRCVAEGGDPAESMAEDILTEGLITISPEDDLVGAADLMSRNQVRRLPVVVENRLIGMVSLGDIVVKQRRDGVAGNAGESGTQAGKRSPQSGKMRPPIVPLLPQAGANRPRAARRKSG